MYKTFWNNEEGGAGYWLSEVRMGDTQVVEEERTYGVYGVTQKPWDAGCNPANRHLSCLLIDHT